MKLYTITEQGIPIGFFQDKLDRDLAFHEHILKTSRFAFKGESFSSKENLGKEQGENK